MFRKKPIAYFVRHGETAGNVNKTFRGTKDIPLDSHGLEDAEKLRDFFKDIPLNAIYSSPKKRAEDTARAVAEAKGMNVQIIDNFNPLHVGYLSGEKKLDHNHVMDYFEKWPNEKIPMGESINEFRQRTQPSIKRILAEGLNAPDPVAAFIHSSIIHELNHITTGDHRQTLVAPGGVVAVYHHPEKGFALKALLNPVIGEGDSKYAG